MMNMIEIDGYRAIIQYDPDIEMFRGEFTDINGGADFYSDDVAGLKREAAKSLQAFLDMCREDGVESRRQFSGRFNLRLPPALHESIVVASAAEGMSLNRWVSKELSASTNESRTAQTTTSAVERSTNNKGDRIGTKAIDWAVLHLQKHGDTDIFPVPFEYQMMGDLTLRKHARDVDLTSYDARGLSTFLVPKDETGFRISHQLDPLDALVYTASVYEMSSVIERGRADISRRVACSYRIQSTESGDFFPADNGWHDYFVRSRDLASSYPYVLHVDIAAFYNHIYHHRLQGALEEVGVSFLRSKNIERFLGKFTARQSRGIPIGPTASHVLAEVCLNDVDQFLEDKGYDYTRYADNFRIFVDDRRSARCALHHLVRYLYTAHRLTVQESKTLLQPADEFLVSRLEDPQRKEEEEQERALQDLIDSVRDASGYADIDVDSLGEDAPHEALRHALTELFQEALDRDPVRTGMARHILRRARSMRTRTLYPLVMSHLEYLVPVFRDVCLYILATFPRNQIHARRVGDKLREFALESDYSCSFVRMWVLHVLQERPAASSYVDAVLLAQSAEQDLGIRPLALLARAFGRTSWVREQKEKVMTLPPWDRRAVIYAGQILPTDERRHWLRIVKGKGDLLDNVIANRLLALS